MTQYDDVEVRAFLREQIEQIRSDRQELQSKLADMDARITRYEAAIAALNGTSPAHTVVEAEPEPQTRQERNRQSRLSPERVSIISTAIANYVAMGHDEFRQADIRNLMADAQLKRSSVMALGFRMLQEAGTIQRTRVEGNNKWFRLTPASVRG